MKKMEEDYRDKQDFLQKLNENYDEIKPINSGGGGIIYQGIHKRLKRKVVLKKIRSDRVSIIGSEREMKILMSLKHTYLPGIVDFWAYEDEVYTVMEFIEGKSFQELLNEGRVFSEKEVIKWTRQLAEVLEYLHNSEQHIIHSDIKPANLMLTPQNNICLIDFNVSVLQGGGEDETIGYSPSYSPVEQLIQMELRGRRKQQERKNSVSQSDESYRATDDDRTEIETVVDADDRTEIDDSRTEVSNDDDRTEIDDDRTEIDDDRTEIDDDRTVVLDDDATEVAYVAVTAPEKKGKLSKKEQKAASPVTAMQQPASRPSVDELTRKYGSRLKVDERSDIYSACATMYHILTGKKPAPCYEKQVPIEDLMPSVNDAFAYILMHGMEQQPKKRFQNAAQLLTAMRQLMKSTKRYKRLLRKQDLFLVILVVLFLGSAGAAYIGWGMRSEEGLTEKLGVASEYYNQGQYVEAIAYLEDNILNNALYQESAQMSQSYYLAGSCYLEQELYTEAVGEYRKAILLDSSVPEYYRDYGIALARSGNLEQARECLIQANAKGLGNDSILLLQGEIAGLEKDYEKAVDYLQECFSSSGDDYVKLSAGLKLDEILGEGYGESAYPDRIALLEDLSRNLAADKKLLVLERMAQVYGDYGQLTQDTAYTEAAVKALDEIITSGFGTLVEWLDKAVFLQSLGRYEEAEDCLLEADKLYTDNYLIYKRLAFLEIDGQASLDTKQRDYHDFESYFNKCDELYRKSGTKSEIDMEMEYLYQVYDEVVVKGWLAE
ncbi:MAG: protein kinase [Lachnospiraceae bacterium]|nr:protein kinase [Lachnospiraceae bacterium]